MVVVVFPFEVVVIYSFKEEVMNKEQSSGKDKINEDSDIDMKPILLWYMGATTHRPKIVLADRIYFSYPENFWGLGFVLAGE